MKLKPIPLFIFFIVTVTAQEQNFKFGKVTKEEVTQTEHPVEAGAEAAILYKKERVFYNYDAKNGFTTNRDAHYRIKIYNKSGLDWGTIEIPLYTSKNGEEVISSIKGLTYNMSNGKVVQTKLKKDGIFKENVSKYRNKASIAMPEVKEGSVIDIEFRVTSDFAGHMNDFQFQYGIPVNVIDVNIEIPQYYIFKRHSKGFYPIQVEQSRKNRKLTVQYREDRQTIGAYRPDVGNGQRNQSSVLEFYENVYSVSAQNIPSMKEEDYTDNIDNYRSAIKFELASTQFPNSGYKHYSLSWDDVAKTIYKYDDFGNELAKTRVVKDVVDLLKSETQDSNQLAFSIFEHLKNRMTWNGYYGVGCEKGLKKAYDEKSGNVADINLLLTTMLRYAGFEANPVLISTKSHGIPLFPTNDGFNYVVVAIENGESTWLLDATEKNAPMGVLPARAMNWRGRLVKEDGTSREINLLPKKASKRLVFMQANLFEDGAVEGKIRRQLTDNEAFAYRKTNNGATLEDRMNAMEEKYLEMEFNDLDIQNEHQLYKPVIESCSFSKESQAELISGKIYFKPGLFLAMTENPFKSDKRDYPVDFKYPKSERLIINFNLPEGYKVESIPENMAIGLPNGLGSFTYSVKQNGNKLNLNCTTEINSGLIPSNYYVALKEFYDQMVVKQTERVVLSKI